MRQLDIYANPNMTERVSFLGSVRQAANIVAKRFVTWLLRPSGLSRSYTSSGSETVGSVEEWVATMQAWGGHAWSRCHDMTFNLDLKLAHGTGSFTALFKFS